MPRDQPAAPPAGVSGDVYDRTLPAVDSTISRMRRGVDAFLAARGVPELRRGDIAIALTEAVTNSVIHAYRGGPPGDVAVRAELREGELALAVCDSGRGMRPRPDSPGLGAGLSLIAHFATRLAIGAGDGGHGTRLELCFSDVRAPTPPRSAPPARDAGMRGHLAELSESSGHRRRDTAALIAEARQAHSRMRALRAKRPRRTS